jgi:hypothetical protein
MSKDNDQEPADLSSFKMTNEVARLLGEMARRGYESLDPADAREEHSMNTLTTLEEVITGLENR